MNGVTWPGMTRVSEPGWASTKTSPAEDRDLFKTGKTVAALDAIAGGCGLRLTLSAPGSHRPSLSGLLINDQLITDQFKTSYSSFRFLSV